MPYGSAQPGTALPPERKSRRRRDSRLGFMVSIQQLGWSSSLSQERCILYAHACTGTKYRYVLVLSVVGNSLGSTNTFFLMSLKQNIKHITLKK